MSLERTPNPLEIHAHVASIKRGGKHYPKFYLAVNTPRNVNQGVYIKWFIVLQNVTKCRLLITVPKLLKTVRVKDTENVSLLKCLSWLYELILAKARFRLQITIHVIVSIC